MKPFFPQVFVYFRSCLVALHFIRRPPNQIKPSTGHSRLCSTLLLPSHRDQRGQGRPTHILTRPGVYLDPGRYRNIDHFVRLWR